jgi:hypothetical protein
MQLIYPLSVVLMVDNNVEGNNGDEGVVDENETSVVKPVS